MATGPDRRRRQAGFTLVELLVVMLIIGLLVALPLLTTSVGGREQRLEKEAERLWQLMRLAAEEALLQGTQLGLLVDAESYRFLVQEQLGGPWLPIEGDRLRQRELPEGLELRVEVQGIRVVLEEREDDRPQVFFLSSGEIIPEFAVELLDRDSDLLWRIEPGRTETLTLLAETY